MTKNFKKIIIFTLLTLFLNLSTHAAVYYYDNNGKKYDPNVDRFVPQQGVKVKESGMAQWMENTTRNAAYSNKSKSRTTTNRKNIDKKNQGPYTKSYKWF